MRKNILYAFVFLAFACVQKPSVNELIAGKWKGICYGNPCHFVLLENKALYFYASSISEMDLFQEQLKKGTNKPVKWEIVDDKYLSFKIHDYAHNYEILDLTDARLVIKDMLEKTSDGEFTLYKSNLTPYEKDYVNENNYNQSASSKNDTVK